jgi:hypothetical protein
MAEDYMAQKQREVMRVAHNADPDERAIRAGYERAGHALARRGYITMHLLDSGFYRVTPTDAGRGAIGWRRYPPLRARKRERSETGWTG